MPTDPLGQPRPGQPGASAEPGAAQGVAASERSPPPEPEARGSRASAGAPSATGLAYGVEHELGEGWIAAENVVGRIVLAVPALGAAVAVCFAVGVSWTSAGACLLGALLLWWLGLRALQRYHRAAFARSRWRLGPDELVWRHGVWWRKVVNVPRSRVQHTDVTRGPIARHYGLATLVIHTAGTSHATITLEGLDADEARMIRDHLLAAGAQDDAV